MAVTGQWRSRALVLVLLCLLGQLFAVAMAPQSRATPGTNDYPYANSAADQVDRWNFYTRECTSFAAWRINNDLGVPFSNYYKGVHWGNANNWDDAARAAGIPVDTTPNAGDIAVFNGGVDGASSFGHVAYVLSVGSGQVQVEDYNWSPYAYKIHTVNTAGLYFIHFKATNTDPHVHHVYGTGGVGLHLRAGPGTSYSTTTTMPEGQQVYVVCQVRSTSNVNGSTIWDQLSSPGIGWASDYYIDTPVFNDFSPGIGQCVGTPPTATIDTGPPAASKDATAAFGFSSSDSVSTFECALDGGAYQSCSPPQSPSGLGDGPHSFSVRATDWAGTGSAATYNWMIDTASPVIQVSTQPNGRLGWYRTAPAVARVSASDAGSGLAGAPSCTVDGQSVTPSVSGADWTIAVSGEGVHHVDCTATDAAGNSRAANAAVSIDTLSPSTGITSGPASHTTSHRARFTMRSSESPATFRCSLDGKAWHGCASPRTYRHLHVGRHVFKVTAVDKAGNVDGSPAVRHWRVK